MAVPKRRKSKSQTKMGRSHLAVKPAQLTYCAQCGTTAPTHAVCPNCGFYQGRTLVEPED